VRLVLDTNVVLDLLHFRDRATLPLGEAQGRGEANFLVDARSLGELERVLAYPEFGLDPPARAALLEAYRAATETLAAGEAPRLPRCRDADDQMFLELAARGGADLLVSKDKALLGLKGRQGLAFAIVTPAGAVERLRNRRR
jgi:putative PIN family toxin of toxin-antitoxin system